MKGKEFFDSKWCKKAATPQGQAEVKSKYGEWAARVSNTGILNRAKHLYQFFISPHVKGMEKVVAAGALLYIFTPLDIIPDFIPVVGWLDDIGVAGFALNYIFSKMDKVEELEAAQKAGLIGDGNASEQELLEGEISGTDKEEHFEVKGATAEEFIIDMPESSSHLEDKLDEVADIANKLHVEGADTFLGRVKNRASQHRIQNIAVVGRYSTGKSSLINALLGKNLLPASPIPTTKAITYVLKGTASLYSEMADGEIVIHESIDALQNLYDKDIQRARKITVALPDFPFGDLTIADTPGLEDPNQDVAQLTLEALPDTDALVVLLDANYMESKVEFQFISSLLQNDRERKLFVVINKCDGKSEQEVAKLVQLCKSHLIEFHVPNARIYALSAKEGQANSGFAKFKSELFAFLRNDLKAEALRHAESELNAYTGTLLDACENAVELAVLDKQEAREKRHSVEEKIDKINSEYDAQEKLLCRKMAGYRSQFFLDFSLFIDQLKGSVRQQIMNSRFDTLRNTDAISAKIKQEIVTFVDGRLNQLDQKLKADFSVSQQKIKAAIAEFDLTVEVKMRDYSQYQSLVLPGAVLMVWQFAGFFTFVNFALISLFGKDFFNSAISAFLSTVGVNSCREKLGDEVAAKLDKCKAEMSEKLNASFDTMENEIIASIQSARNSAVAPMALMTSQATLDLSQINDCRTKLLKYN